MRAVGLRRARSDAPYLSSPWLFQSEREISRLSCASILGAALELSAERALTFNAGSADSPVNNAIDITSDYMAKFGTPQVGQRFPNGGRQARRLPFTS